MKKTKKVDAIETVAHLNDTIDAIARQALELRELEVRRDQEIQAVRERHDLPIEEAKKRMKGLTAQAETYCLAHRGSLFVGKAKSAMTALARFGFRETPPKLCTLNRKWTWDAVLELLRQKGRFVRVAEEVDKEAIKVAGLGDGELAELGMRLDQEEKFFVDPKVDEEG